MHSDSSTSPFGQHGTPALNATPLAPASATAPSLATATAPAPATERPALIWRTALFLTRQFGISTLVYLAIFAFVIVALDIIFQFTTGGSRMTSPSYAQILPSSNAVYLLVVGIIAPHYLEAYLSQGLTRKQFALALLATGALLTLGLTLIAVLVAAATANLTPEFLVATPLGLWCCFLVGWVASIGFQFRRVIPSTLGIVCCCVLGTLFLSLGNGLLPGLPIFSSRLPNDILSLPLPIGAALILLASLTLAATLVALSHRIPVKS